MLFLYKGIHAKTGKEIKGKVSAASYEVAVQELKGKQLHITELKEQKETLLNKGLNLTLGNPVKTKDFVIFCRQLSTLINSGTPITDSIKLLSAQVSSKVFQKALEAIHVDLRAGSALSDACSKYPKIFDRIFINMVRAGEASGDLENVLDRLSSFYEKERKVVEKVKSALMYPIVVSIVALITVFILLVYVLPNILNNLVSSGGDIPFITKVVISSSNFLIHQWYIIMLLLVSTFVGFVVIKRNERGQYFIDYVKLRIPIFGSLIQKTVLARVSRTMSSLFSSSVPVLQTLTMTSEISNNKVFAKVLNESKESLRSGESLSSPLANSWVFPPIFHHMVKIGEETGQLDAMLDKIAEFYEDEVEQTASRLSSIIEPIMIVILAVVVGTIVLATFLPMISIYDQF